MQNESELAKSLLRIRDNGFPSPLTSLIGRKPVHLLRYLVFCGLVLFLVMRWSDFEARAFLLGLLGFFVGGIFKEMAFMNKIRANWVFSRKVTNWELVERLAEGTPLPPPPLPE
ncbi:MAG: hypothetical protein ABII82_01680 [Verrucomicrobiota bacterium]